VAKKLFTAKTSSFLTLAGLINDGHEFHNSNKTFRGEHWDADHASLPGKGKMPESEYSKLELLHRLRGIDYVVFSYYTPIAYRTTNGMWHMPSVRYSNTTSQHQGKISAAAHQLMIQKGLINA
jgi:hypothetical protein